MRYIFKSEKVHYFQIILEIFGFLLPFVWFFASREKISFIVLKDMNV